MSTLSPFAESETQPDNVRLQWGKSAQNTVCIVTDRGIGGRASVFKVF